MKVVLFFKKMNIGGAERSTVRLLNTLSEAGMDVTLFLWTKGGALEKELFSDIKIRYLFHDTGVLKTWDRTVKGLFKLKPQFLFDAIVQYIKGNVRRFFFRFHKVHYDLAITGYHGYDPYFLKRYTKYNVHFQMIRSENAIVINGVPRTCINKYKKNLDIIDAYICVSKQVRNTMLEYCDIPPERVFTIYNIISLDKEKIMEASKPVEYSLCKKDEICIVTVCRLYDKVKGLLRMIHVCDVLRKKYQFKWFVVGDGSDREKMQSEIEKRGLQDTMILCGFRTNPIPYYIYADLVAVFSYVEGLCGVVNEAKLLQKPLIATRFTSIDEQIQHGINGYIVDNDEMAIVEGMEYLINNRDYLESLAINGLPAALRDNTFKIRQIVDYYNQFDKEKKA